MTSPFAMAGGMSAQGAGRAGRRLICFTPGGARPRPATVAFVRPQTLQRSRLFFCCCSLLFFYCSLLFLFFALPPPSYFFSPPIEPGFSRVSLRFVIWVLLGFYWVLLGYTGFLLGFTGFYWVLLVFFKVALLVLTGKISLKLVIWVLLGFTEFYWVFTGFYLVLLGFIGY